MPICVPSSSISLTCGARIASLIRARSAGRTGISTARRGLKGSSPSSCFLLPRKGSAAAASGRGPHPSCSTRAVQSLEGSKVCEQILEARRRLPTAAIAHGESLLGLAVAVDDRLRDLLHLGIADSLRHRLAALVEVGPIPRGRDAVSDRPRRLPVRLSDGNHAHLHGCEPEREGARVVLDQDADKALQRAKERSVY